MNDQIHTPILDRVRYPSDLRRLSDAELAQCADELRAETIQRRFRDRRSSGLFAGCGGTDGRHPRGLQHAV